MLDPERDHCGAVIVCGLGTLQESVPESIIPPSRVLVVTSIPLTGSVEIGLEIPFIVKLKVPEELAAKKFVMVTNCVEDV